MDMHVGQFAHRPTLPDPVKAVIFDMDGTLLDTETVHRRAMGDASRALGWELDHEVVLKMVGINREANQLMLAEHLGPDFPMAQFFMDSDVLFEAALEAGIPMRPGADVIVEHLARAGIPMAIATSTRAPFAQRRLEQAGLLHYFEAVVTRNDVTQPKPHPEPYLLASRLLGVDPASAVAVEDSYAGIRAATAAGIATVMVPDLLPPTDELVVKTAAVLPSLIHLRDLLMSTPPRQDGDLVIAD
ncbi:HAD family phosphatase [Sphingobium sp. H39-3-25]|uniref:HAD family hydrolase n=1 Tax=Sphingobium arseniciresistens TaxID=3030834 RepID=UPI0023B91CC4|nr:HAD family phosphatase [Sphingobium arseniciresistens]